MTHSDQERTPVDEQGFRIALLFIGLFLVLAALLSLYLLLWDGGGNMS